jgi:hypothetical protein
VRGSLSGSFLRLTGGTLTGPLTISANVDGLLVLNRPDGADHAALVAQMAGADVWELEHWAAEPKLRIADPTAARKITLNTSTADVGITGKLSVTVNDAAAIVINRPDGLGKTGILLQHGGVQHARYSVNVSEPHVSIESGDGTSVLTVRGDTGLLGTGLIPLSMLRVGEEFAGNAGIVTIAAAATTIAALASINVAAGDRIYVTGRADTLKGATAGQTIIYLAKLSGTATISWMSTFSDLRHAENVVAGAALSASPSGMARVTGAGTLVLELGGSSSGSDSSVAAGAGQLHALVLRG